MKMMAVAALLVGAFLAVAAPSQAINDVDILNFALNLEYLEAEFYSFAVYGKGIDASLRGGGPAPEGPSNKATLTFPIDRLAAEIAKDELNHVKFLRAALGKSAVPSPKINVNSAFAAAADAAFGTTLKPAFTPYSNNIFFLHGAFIFEDVGVTAYAGAAALIESKAYLTAAAGILAVEAYHAGSVRLALFRKSYLKVKAYGVRVYQIVGAISKLRAKLGGGKDQNIILGGGKANIVPTDSNSVAFTRTPAQVVDIVTAAGAGNKGLFFPNGLNGNIKG